MDTIYRRCYMLAHVSNPRNLRNELFFPLEQHFDRFFQDFFNPKEGKSIVSSGYPKLDAVRTNDEFLVKVAVPGVTLENLKIEVDENNVLQISGEMSSEYKQDNSDFYVRELHKSRFSRSLSIPVDVDGDPEALLKDGILQLKWKLHPKVIKKPKLIEVKT
ncbi:unnamed protein product [Sphagnum jensenii]|uniref:SHSP domain-containing protein n=1 Tax=Sphagnum jensenii TaxID=128206 RepID=A0ABP0VA28_9BRYO